MTSHFSYDDIFRELIDDLEIEVKDFHLDNLYGNFEEDNIQNKFNQMITNKKKQHRQSPIIVLIDKSRKNDDNTLSNELPEYLSQSSLSFRTTFFPILRSLNNPITLEDLQQLAILIHHMYIIYLQKQLWRYYLQSLTNQFIQNHQKQKSLSNYKKNMILSLWSKSLRSKIMGNSLITVDTNNDRTNDNICIDFVHKYLQYLEKKANQYRIQFHTIKHVLSNYTDIIGAAIAEFVQKEGLIAMRLYYEMKMTLIKHICTDQLIQEELFQQKPTDLQLQLAKHICQLTLDKEKAEQELILLKVGILYKQLPKSLDILEVSLPISITSISNSIIHERLSKQYLEIIQRTKADLMIVLTTAAEARGNDKRKNYDKEMTEIWKGQQQLSIDERLTTTMLTLIDERQKNIIECIKCIYEFKGYFSHKVPKTPIIHC